MFDLRDRDWRKVVLLSNFSISQKGRYTYLFRCCYKIFLEKRVRKKEFMLAYSLFGEERMVANRKVSEQEQKSG